MMRKVVVIGRNYTSRLGMIRALGRAGYYVIVINTLRKCKDIDAYSRYVKEYLFAKEPNRDLLIAVIRSIKKRGDEKIILVPVDDYAASTIDENITELKNDYLFPHVGMASGAINHLMDKNVQKIFAEKVGLSVAKGWIVKIENGKYELPEGIEYPCFTKPQISFMGNKEFMRVCYCNEDLKNVVEDVACKVDCPILVEQYVNIEKEYATLGFSDGKHVVLPAMIRLLQDGRGPHKGVTLQGCVLPTMGFEEYLKKIELFILNLGFVGLFDVDSFESNGVIYFNELNLRFGASGFAITNLGVNLPEQFASYLIGRNDNYRKEVGKNGIFLNEKVAYDDVVNGFITFKNFKALRKSSDFFFIKDRLDMYPYLRFKWVMLKNSLRKLIKG